MFSAYLRSGGTGVRGTVEFTGDGVINFSGAGSQVQRHANVMVRFKAVTVADAVTDPFAANVKNQGSWEVSDYLQIGAATIDRLVVGSDLTVRGPAAAKDASGPVLVVSELLVNSGATLTVGTKGQSADVGDGSNRPDNPIQLRVPLQRGDKDSSEDFTVKGTIVGTGAIWIAHTAAY